MSDKNNNTDYVPFGEEWVKEMMKINKKDLVQILKTALQKNVGKQFGKVNSTSTHYLFCSEVGDTEADADGKRYELMIAMHQYPIVKSCQTKKTFALRWDEIIEMAIMAGVDDE